MKQFVLLLALMGITCTSIKAHDFEVANSEGVTIYYTITSSTDLTVAVTYRGSSYSEYPDEYSGSVVIPETVTYEDITYNVTSIGSYAFTNCKELTSIDLPNSISNLGDYTFFGCETLTSVHLPTQIKEISSYCFSYCSSLAEIELPQSIVAIREYAFWYSSLKTINLHENITIIESCAFASCNLEEIQIPSSVTTIADGLCQNSKSLKRVVLPNSITSIGHYAFSCCVQLEDVSIGEKVTSIGAWAFYYTAIKSITIPKNVKIIYSGAFDGSFNEDEAPLLEEVIIEDSDEPLQLLDRSNRYSEPFPYTVKTIYLGRDIRYPNDDTITYAYSTGIGSIFPLCDARNLVSLTIGNKVKNIARWLFVFSKITDLNIPDNVISVGPGAFDRCTVKSVSMSNSLNSIEDYTFRMTKLESVIIPESVISIGCNAFQSCSFLKIVSLPSHLSEIDPYAFDGCTSLSSIYSYNPTPAIIYEKTFSESTQQNAILYVPVGSYERYKNADYWKNFLNIVEFDPTGIEGIFNDTAMSDSHNNAFYTIDGRKMEHLQRGVNIVRQSNGTVRKLMVK